MSLGVFSTYSAGWGTTAPYVRFWNLKPDPEQTVVLHYRLGHQVSAISVRRWCSLHRWDRAPGPSLIGGAVPDNLLPAENLKMHQVQVHRMGITGGIPDFPFLGRTEGRVFGGGAVPGGRPFHLTDQTGVNVCRGIRPVDRDSPVKSVAGSAVPSKGCRRPNSSLPSNSATLRNRVGAGTTGPKLIPVGLTSATAVSSGSTTSKAMMRSVSPYTWRAGSSVTRSPPKGSSPPTFFMMTRLPGVTFLKSTMTS